MSNRTPHIVGGGLRTVARREFERRAQARRVHHVNAVRAIAAACGK